jgi:MSHA biogenesis protein MshI
VLNRLNAYLKNMRQIPRFGKTKSTPKASNRCCLAVTATQISLVYFARNGKNSELQLLETREYTHPNELGPTLNALVEQYQLRNVACSWVLKTADYQLIPIDTLPVTAAEFQAAIRWKIKSLIDFPIADAAIDSFSLPQQISHNMHKSITVVVARVSYLKKISALIIASGLNLTTIDIPELTLRNITSLYEQDEKTTALIYLTAIHSKLIITRQRVLYFQRHLPMGLDSLATSTAAALDLDTIALELQRSFDYYQSQWRQPPAARILLAATSPVANLVFEEFAAQLAIPITPLDIKPFITSKIELTRELQGRYLTLIGGALRDESVNHAAAN